MSVLGVTGCAGPKSSESRQRTEPPSQLQPLFQKLEEGQAKKRALEAEYKAMPVSELVRRLEVDSEKDVEPFNSLAYREVTARGRGIAKDLAAAARTQDRRSLLSLVALRKVDADLYGTVDLKIKTAILFDALRTSKYFNTWGLPHLYWEDAAKAVIQLGDAAVEPLKTLLQDERAAPVWGSEEVMEYKKYKYRVKDYAWALLVEVKGEKLEMPADPGLRDQMIANTVRR
jgi:hypothetical protein